MFHSAILWTVALQAPLFMEFSRQEYRSGFPCPFQGIFLTRRLNWHLLHLLHWQVDSLPLSHLGNPNIVSIYLYLYHLYLYHLCLSMHHMYLYLSLSIYISESFHWWFQYTHTHICSSSKTLISGTSLVVQLLRIHLPMQGMWVQSLVGELRSHMPRDN